MPTTGSFSWGIMLCKFSGQPEEPRAPRFFRDMISEKGTGSLNDYWRTMSYGNLDMSDATVYGWLTLPSARDEKFLSLTRFEKIRMCAQAVVASFEDDLEAIRRFGRHDGFIAVIAGDAGDGGAAGGGILLDSKAWKTTFIAHETGHVLGLDHSFDTNSAPWDALNDNRPGAYGNSRDIMSAATFGGLPATFPSRFVEAGPALNGPTRERLGWLPATRISEVVRRPGEDFSTHVEVGALNNPESPRNLLLKVAASDFHNGVPLGPMTYTVEFRPKEGWDAGIAADAVVIHIIREGDHPRIAWADDDSQDWRPNGRFVDLARRISISVVRIAPDTSTATLFLSAGSSVVLPLMSVRKSLAHKFDLKKGLRAITPSPPFARDSVRARLLDNPPQFAA